MAMYISVDEQRVRIKRSDSEVGGTFWKVDGSNASCVFEVAYRAKQDNEETHGYMYDVLKRGGRALSIRRNNIYADALIFAATGIARELQKEIDNAYREAVDRNNCGEFDEFYELYA